MLEYLPKEMAREHKKHKDGLAGKSSVLGKTFHHDDFLGRKVNAEEARSFGIYAKAILDTNWKSQGDKTRLKWLKSIQARMNAEAEKEAKSKRKKPSS